MPNIMIQHCLPLLLMAAAVTAVDMYNKDKALLASNDYPLMAPGATESVIDVAIIIDGSDLLPTYSSMYAAGMPSNNAPPATADSPLSSPQTPQGGSAAAPQGSMAAGVPIPIVADSPAASAPSPAGSAAAPAAASAPSPAGYGAAPQGSGADSAPASHGAAAASAPSEGSASNAGASPAAASYGAASDSEDSDAAASNAAASNAAASDAATSNAAASDAKSYGAEKAATAARSGESYPSASESRPSDAVYAAPAAEKAGSAPAPAPASAAAAYGGAQAPAAEAAGQYGAAAPTAFPRSDVGFQQRVGDYVPGKQSPFQDGGKGKSGNYTVAPSGTYPNAAQFVSGTYQAPKGAGAKSSAPAGSSSTSLGVALIVTLLVLTAL